MSTPELRSLLEIMEQFDAGKLFISITGLSNLGHGIEQGGSLAIPLSNYHNVKEQITHACAELERLNMPVSLGSANDLRAVVEGEVNLSGPVDSKWGQLVVFESLPLARYRNFSKELVARFKHEAGSRMALLLDAKAAAYFDASEPLFGDPVDKAFPDCADDIEEAGKCLALDRPTACVFHLMRAAEAVAAVLSARIGGETHDSRTGERLTFGSLYAQVEAKVRDMPRGDEKDAWLHLDGLMKTLNRGTRTKVAHPGTWYLKSKAEAILGQTKAFLQEAEELLRP
jgi:hypothetical protein